MIPRINLTVLAIFTSFLSPPQARAESEGAHSSKGLVRVSDPIGAKNGDGIYGRFNGDLSLRIGVGIEGDFGTKTLRPLIVGELVAYHSLGLYGTMRESVADEDSIERIVSTGLTISPLFLLRWSNDWHWGNPYASLFIDSLTASAGVHFSQPETRPFADKVGFEGGLSAGVPWLGRANGPWLRARWNFMSNRNVPVSTLWLFVSWEGFVYTGMLSVE